MPKPLIPTEQGDTLKAWIAFKERLFTMAFLSALNLSRPALKARHRQNVWYVVMALPILFISCNQSTPSAHVNNSSPPPNSRPPPQAAAGNNSAAGGNSSRELTLEEISSLCNRVSEIKVIPHKDEAVNDAAYNALIAAGEKAVPCLIRKVTDTTSTTDPRSAPTYHGMKVGDVALFVLSDITKLDFTELLPASVREEFNTQGVDAYFRYTQNKKNREQLQSALYDWYQKKYRRDARQL